MVWLVYAALAVNALGVLSAFALPFVVKALKGPRAAALASKLCTATAFAGAVASIVSIRLAAIAGAGLLMFVVPLTVLAGASCIYWTIVGLMHASRKDLERVSKERERRARANRQAG